MGKLGFGMQKMPLLDPNDDKNIDWEQLYKMVDYYMENGGNYFDCARSYHSGTCEKIFKRAVSDRYPRDRYELTEKFSCWLIEEAGGCKELFESQLKECGVDYFDNYMYHALNDEAYKEMNQIGGFDFVKNLKKEGRIRHIGLQFHDGADVLEKILTEHPEIEFVHLMFNYAEWDSPVFELSRCYDIIKNHNCQIVTMYPVMAGVLQNGLPEEAQRVFKACRPDMSLTSWALRSVGSMELVKIVLCDMSNYEQMVDNISYMKDMKPLDEEEQEALAKVQQILKEKRAISCTACDKCLPVCPEKLAISKYIALYVDQKQFGLMPSLHRGLMYGSLKQNHGMMSECADCALCVSKCPENIDIPAIMKRAAVIFDGEMKREASPYDRFEIGETDKW